MLRLSSSPTNRCHALSIVANLNDFVREHMLEPADATDCRWRRNRARSPNRKHLPHAQHYNPIQRRRRPSATGKGDVSLLQVNPLEPQTLDHCPSHLQTADIYTVDPTGCARMLPSPRRTGSLLD